MDEALKKYLESKYDPAVLAAEDADRDIQGNTNAGLMRSAAQIGTFGGKTSDASPFADTVKANQAARARSTKGYTDAYELQGDRAMKGAQAKKLGAETAAIEGESDPNSQTSIAFRDTIRKVMPEAAKIPGFEGMSYTQLHKATPLLAGFKPKEAKEAPRGTKVGTTPDGKIVYSDGTREWTGTTGVAMDATTGGKPVGSDAASKIGQFSGAANILDNLAGSWNAKAAESGSGVKQFIKGSNAYNYEQERKAAAQGIGTVLEEGKLSESDLPRYIDMLPGSSDTPKTAAVKIANIRRLIEEKLAGTQAGQTQAGYNTAGFKPLNPMKNSIRIPGQALAAPQKKPLEDMTQQELDEYEASLSRGGKP